MFYHKNSEIIDTPSSYLDPQQVFTGNYWDEFGFTPYLVPDMGRVLMLGLGFGGGLRPLFSSTKKIQLECIDLDNFSIKSCRQLFDQKYSEINFEIKNIEAKKFLQSSKDHYDLIWLDLYNSDSYSELYFDEEFISLLKLHLSAHGVLAINSYGIPTQFKPLTINSVQRECARTLQQNFSFVGTIPNRRNQTFLASSIKPLIHEAKPHEKLSPIDKLSFLVQGVRLQYLEEISKLTMEPLDIVVESKFCELDRHMQIGWKSLLQTLNFYDINLSTPKELLKLIQNPQQCETFLEKALLAKDINAVTFLPILCAGESHVHNIDVTWIFKWILKNHKILTQIEKNQFIDVWLTQLWFLILHPSKKYRVYCFEIFALFKENL